MARKQDMVNGSNNRQGGLLKFLIMNPTLIGFLALIILGVILYTIQAVSGEANDIMKMYDIIGNDRKDSKADFDKRLFYITINTDGTKSVTVGFSSEIEKEQALRAASEAGTGIGNFDNSAISAELDEFITDVRAKESTISLGSAIVGYYVMNLSNDLSFAAGVMGNSAGEGTLGQWQYQSNSLELSHGIYSSNYSGKLTTDMKPKCRQHYDDLKKVSAWNKDNKPKIGWGPTQATYYTNINKYVKAMETMGIHTLDRIITEGDLKTMESLYVTATFNKNIIRNPNTTYMKEVKYSSDEVYNKVYSKIKNECDMLGVPLTKSIVYDTYAVFINYERPSGYDSKTEGLNSCAKRAVKAIKAYIAMQEVNNEK